MHLCTLTRASLGRLDQGACAALARVSLGRLREPDDETPRPSGGVGYAPDFSEREAKERRKRLEREAARRETIWTALFGEEPDITQPLPAETRQEVAQVVQQELIDTGDIDAKLAEMLALIDAIWLEMQEEEALVLLLLS